MSVSAFLTLFYYRLEFIVSLELLFKIQKWVVITIFYFKITLISSHQ